ncbi:MAG: helix-turn-helix transcriptional regulator [Flammeovirgaceae bacterium]
MKDSFTPANTQENTQKGSTFLLYEKDDITLALAQNDSDTPLSINHEITKGVIHFYFCVAGSAVFQFGPHYSREIGRQKNYFFYNPDKDMPFALILAPETKMVLMSISLQSLHQLFVSDALPILNPANSNQKFYDEKDIPASLMLVLNQLFTTQLSESAQKLFFQGKVYELLSLYFSLRQPNSEACPFLKDQETVRKIKQAKDYLLKNLDASPSLKELAKAVSVNEYQLKAGFKEIYGQTVHSFLLDHKLDQSRLLLDSGKFLVNEAAYQVGYTNPSHFIAAFKKKFGVTPKKYLMKNSRG